MARIVNEGWTTGETTGWTTDPLREIRGSEQRESERGRKVSGGAPCVCNRRNKSPATRHRAQNTHSFDFEKTKFFLQPPVPRPLLPPPPAAALLPFFLTKEFV